MDIYRQLYDNVTKYLKPEAVAEAIIKIAEYEYHSKFSVDLEINVMALIVELIGIGGFK